MSLNLLLATLAIFIYPQQKLASLATATFLTIFYELHRTSGKLDAAPLASLAPPRMILIFLPGSPPAQIKLWCKLNLEPNLVVLKRAWQVGLSTMGSKICFNDSWYCPLGPKASLPHPITTQFSCEKEFLCLDLGKQMVSKLGWSSNSFLIWSKAMSWFMVGRPE